MQPLFNITTLNKIKSSTKLPFKCEFCSETFYVEAKYVKTGLKHGIVRQKFCNPKCFGNSKNKEITTNCGQCGKQLIVKLKEHKKSKSGFSFCNHSCAIIYNNAHKTTGTRRSKLESWLEAQLRITFPNLEILYNKKETINSELDFYIPSLNLAFELNGIFHYEPIYGADKLTAIQNNDNRKFQAYLEQGIELVIIDSSGQKRFTEKSSQKYLDIIANLINYKLTSCPTD